MMRAAEVAPDAAQEWRDNWRLVASGALAVTWMTAPVASLSLFLAPLHDAFGWSFTTLSSGLLVYSVISVLLVPVAGAIVDRYGTRAVAVPGLLLNGFAFAAFALLTSALASWFAIWVAYTLTQLLIGTFVWSGATSAAFSRSRGLAIGVVMGGIALGQLVAPFVARILIEGYGWRAAFAALGIGWAGLAFVVCLVWFHDPRSARRRSAAGVAGAAMPASPPGLTLAQAMRTPRFLRICAAILLQAMIVSGLTVHIIQLLTGAGISRAGATTMAGLIGVAALAGQIVTGWLADRVSSAVLPAVCFVVPAIAYALVLSGTGSPPLLWAGVLLAGYGSGAAINVTTYLVTRYVGLAHFGKIYGVISSCMRLGAGIGPLLAGVIVDRSGSYALFLVAGIGCALAAGLLVLRLGAYPDFARREEPVFA